MRVVGMIWPKPVLDACVIKQSVSLFAVYIIKSGYIVVNDICSKKAYLSQVCR